MKWRRLVAKCLVQQDLTDGKDVGELPTFYRLQALQRFQAAYSLQMSQPENYFAYGLAWGLWFEMRRVGLNAYRQPETEK